MKGHTLGPKDTYYVLIRNHNLQYDMLGQPSN